MSASAISPLGPVKIVDLRPCSCAAAFFSLFLAALTDGVAWVGGAAGTSTGGGGGGGGAALLLLHIKSPIQMDRNQP